MLDEMRESQVRNQFLTCHFFAFIPGKKTFTTEIIATVTKAGKIPNAEGNDFFEMVPVLIPTLTPTMKSSRCIKISYQIKVISHCSA